MKHNDLDLSLKVANMYPNSTMPAQVCRRVMIRDEVLGTLYDNRNCEEQRPNYVFLPVNSSRIEGRYLCERTVDDTDYLHRAEGVRGDELMDVLEGIRAWAEAVQEWVRERRTELRAVLDFLPEPGWELSRIGAQHIGLTCQILGPCGSFTQDLSWANIAKLIGNSFSARGEYQIADAGVCGRDWGTMWYSWSYEPALIHWGSYAKDTLLTVTRIPDSVPDDDQFDNSTCHLSEEAAR